MLACVCKSGNSCVFLIIGKIFQAELEEQLESKTGEHLAVTADISGMLQVNKIHQEALREHCKHIDDLRTKLTEAKISTLLKGDDAQHLDAEDVHQKSCVGNSSCAGRPINTPQTYDVQNAWSVRTPVNNFE